MNGEAKELRELARDIYALAGSRRCWSMAQGAVNALCDYLCLRARVMELGGESVLDRHAGTLDPVDPRETTSDASSEKHHPAAQAEP